MKTIFKYLSGAILMMCLLAPWSGHAQDMRPERASGSNNFFIELGGPSMIYSFNYDFRFDRSQRDGWGMRAGLGGFYRREPRWDSSEGMLVVPVQVNKLFGNGRHFFEVGGGASFVYFQDTFLDWNTQRPIRRNDYDFILDLGETPSLLGTFTLGYRLVPEKSGFLFRAQMTPIFNQNGFWPFWFGVSFGYSF